MKASELIETIRMICIENDADFEDVDIMIKVENDVLPLNLDLLCFQNGEEVITFE